jgi:Rrf2 family protein
MKITAQEEYGLRCMLQLARIGPGESLTLADIAEREALSLPYVGKLMARLRGAGLVDSVRGRSGGYLLPRPAGEIRVSEVLAALGDHLFEGSFCDRHHGTEDECVHIGLGCQLRSLWGVLETLIADALAHTTLANLLSGEAILTLLEQRARIAGEVALPLHASLVGSATGPLPVRGALLPMDLGMAPPTGVGPAIRTGSLAKVAPTAAAPTAAAPTATATAPTATATAPTVTATAPTVKPTVQNAPATAPTASATAPAPTATTISATTATTNRKE